MKEVIILFLGIFVGVFCVYFVMRSIGAPQGIAAHTRKQQSEKQSRKEKIFEILRDRGSVTNDDIEKSLNVSDTTATNYLQELEREGKIEQIGERGRFVSYRLKRIL